MSIPLPFGLLQLGRTIALCLFLGTLVPRVMAAPAPRRPSSPPCTVQAITQNVTVSLNGSGTAAVTAAQVNNGSTASCGFAAGGGLSVSPSSFTCANIGANTVTLTVTDVNGNTNSAPATVTVQDVSAPVGASMGPLPAAPATAVANVPEAAGYGVLYQLNVPTAAAFNSLASVPYAVNNSGLSIPTPARVAYYMELTNSSTGAVSWAWASMDNFAATLPQLGLPHPTANNVAWHQSVTNLNVYASSGAGVSTGTGKTGRVEMWYWDYSAANSDNVPGASGGTYDFGDQNSGSGGYGSFQVHNLTNAQTVLAYNHWGNNGGGSSDVGLGNQSTGQPDWTFAANTGTYSVRKLYVLVPNGGSFTQNATLSLNASGQATLSNSNVYTGATDNCSGPLGVTLSKTAFTCADLGANLVSVTVTDAAGNQATQLTTVTVQDVTAPTPHAQNVLVNLDAFGSATITASQVNNGSVDNCGVASLSVLPNSFTCANIGANTVTLTVTDASGNTATTTATVTVQDVTAPSAGVLPAAPATAVANVPEAAGYGVLYQLNVPTAAAFNSLASVPYAVNNSGLSIPTPARVAYFMELTNNSTGAVSWAWASMDNFAATLPQLGLPHPTANNVAWHQSVTNLNVYASSGAGVSTGTGKTGRVEMWYWNYNQNNVDNVPGASSSTYDFGDQNSGSGGYGSFQVHNLTNAQTVLAYNNWGSNGGNGDIGLGNQSTSNPDWTFAANTATYSVRKLYVLVPNGTGSGSFVQNATLPLSSNGTATLAQNQVYLGASDNCGIATVTVTPNSFTCANLGANTVTVKVTDNSGNATSQTATVTVVDNLAPVGSGAGVLPAAPLLATSNVPEASNYGVLYQLDVPTAGASFNNLAAVPYTVNNSGAAMATPARVAYFMELTNSSTGAVSWAWASMDNFAATLPQLGLPHPTANNVAWHQSVTNLNVYASSGAGVSTGTGLGTGRIEMWPTNYGQTNSDNVPGASGGTYDFGDQYSNGGGYGSFQVHNVTASQTVLAYNNWGASGAPGDIGIGNQSTGSPDWTFANNAGNYSVKRLYILALNGGSFVQNATLSIPAGGTATLGQNQVYTGASDNCTVASVAVSQTAFTCANAGVNTVQVQVTDNSGNMTTQSAFVTVSVPVVATTTWNGATSADWTNCANWSYGRVPDATTNAVLPAGMPNYPSLPAGTYPVQNLTIASGAALATAGGATLQVSGDWTNNGTATLAGPVTFTGSAPTQTLGGTTPTNFTVATVNKASGTVQLAQNMPIGISLTMTSGTLTTTASYFVQHGSTATLSETNTSYVVGGVRTTRTLTPGTAEAFGGMGLTLTPATGSTAPGNTQVVRTTGTALTGAGSSTSILRYFNIVPTVNTGLNVTMNFAYFAHELNGIPTANLALFKSVSGGTPWMLQRYTTASTNLVTKTGITDFSVWTLGNATNPLPVELVEFTAQAQGAEAVRLAWSTASEKNADRFEVERSTNGSTFDRIGAVAAAGTSSAANTYVLLDRQLPKADRLYYRLQQVDLDGTSTYSPVRTITRLAGNAASLNSLAVYPNPTTGLVQVSGLLAGNPVLVRDALGRLVATAVAPADGSVLALTLPASLPTGVYVVQSGGHSVRLAVQ